VRFMRALAVGIMPKLIRDKILGKGYGKPLDDHADRWFISELEIQSSFALASFGEIMTKLASNLPNNSIFAFCHMQLVFGGNVSKILFPNKRATNRIKKRAKRIRVKLNVPSLPLLSSVTGRNFVEHFDERMDRYVGKVSGILFHRYISVDKPDTIDVDGKNIKSNFLQHFNTRTNELSLFDEVINIDDLNNEMLSINDLTKQYLAYEQSS
jgi:hypothetical protein